MALYVVKHKIYDDAGNDNYCGKVLKETGHTYVCGEESEVKALVDDLNNKSSLTKFPRTEEQEDSIISEISMYRYEQEKHPEIYNEIQDKINLLYMDLNDGDRYNYWCWELIHFLDASSARAFLM